MIITTIDALQWAGCATGVAGASLLALNNKFSGWGFVLFLISNGFWTAFGIQTHAVGLVTTQVVFTATSLLGIYRWLGSRPPMQKRPGRRLKRGYFGFRLAQIGHQEPLFFISPGRASHSCPTAHLNRIFNLLPKYSVVKHSPPRSTASC